MTIDLGFLPLGFTILFITTVLPVKLAASFMGASYDNWGSIALAVALGLVAGLVVLILFDGFKAVVVAYLVISAIYWQILKPSFIGAFGLTFIALVLQVAILQGIFTTIETVAS